MKVAAILLLALALCGAAQARQLQTKKDACKYKAEREYTVEEFCAEFDLKWEVVVEHNDWCADIEVIKAGSVYDLPCDCESKTHGADWHWKRSAKRHYEGEVCEYTPEAEVVVAEWVYEADYDWDTCVELNPWILEVKVIKESCFIPCKKHKSEKRIHMWPEMEDHPCDQPSWRPYNWFEQEDVYERRWEEHAKGYGYAAEETYGQEKYGYGEEREYGYGRKDSYGEEKYGYGRKDSYGEEKYGYGEERKYGQERKYGYGEERKYGQERKYGYGEEKVYGEERKDGYKPDDVTPEYPVDPVDPPTPAP